MTAAVHQLTPRRDGPSRYPDHVDLRSVIRQGDRMKSVTIAES